LKTNAYKLSCGVVIARVFPDQTRFLLLRAFNYWDFPKGMLEEGEDPFQAAIREVREETGLIDLEFLWGKGYQETPPYGMGKIARYYLAQSQTGEVYLPVNPELGRPEHEEFRWLPYDEARAILAPRLKSILNWADWLIQWGKDGRA